MKRYLQLCIGMAALSLSFSAFSAPAAGAAMTGTSMTGAAGGEHPCKAIEEACKNAGFAKGSGLMKDCMKPLLAGQAVKNIAIPADQLEACKAKIAARQASHGAGAGGAPGAAGAAMEGPGH